MEKNGKKINFWRCFDFLGLEGKDVHWPYGVDRDGEVWPEAITGPADRKAAGWFACGYSRAMGFTIKMNRGLLAALPG